MSDIEQALNHIIASVLKRDDAPCSSATHLNTAIVLLCKLAPDWVPHDLDGCQVVEDAEEEMRLLGFRP